MWCWRPAQIGPHQAPNEAVASLVDGKKQCGERRKKMMSKKGVTLSYDTCWHISFFFDHSKQHHCEVNATTLSAAADKRRQ